MNKIPSGNRLDPAELDARSSPPARHAYELLGPDQVLDAVESLGLITNARIFALNSYENRVYQIGLEDGSSVIAKFYRPGRWSDDSILEEHAFSAELAELEIPVVPPSIVAGKTLHRFEIDGQPFRFSLFPRLAGRAPELDDLDNLQVMGRFLGRLHRVGARTRFEHRNTLNVQDWAAASRDYLLTQAFLPPSLRSAYDSLSADLIQAVTEVFASAASVKQLRLHGDCHPGNVLWRDDQPWFVDFDDAINGPAIQDLWMLLSGERDQRQAQLLEIVEAYEEFNEFDVRELPMIEALRTLRMMHYSAWLARRWDDPAFPQSFPWFNTERYWAAHILELREQMAALNEPPLQLFPY